MITLDELRSYLNYDLDTGIFTWAIPTARNIKVGAKTGLLKNTGYVQIRFKNKYYLAHRLAWMYVTGVMPKVLIDHINGDKTDNRFCNLRESTYAQNIQNVKKAFRNNKLGLLGTTYRADIKKFISRITVNKKLIQLGHFNSAEEAHQAYLTAKRKIHEYCTI